MSKCTVLWLALLMPLAAIPQASDEAEIERVVAEFLSSREDGQRDRLSELLTPDVDQQVTSGAIRSGRQAVLDGSLAATRRTGGQRTISVESIRFITPDVALVDGPYDIVGVADGPDRHFLATIVMKKEAGNWRIAAIRNMQPTQ